MDLDRLYILLKQRPRDARWLLRKLGPDYRGQLEALEKQGRPVKVGMEDVEGVNRVVYRAADQGELFSSAPAPKRRRRRRQRRPA